MITPDTLPEEGHFSPGEVKAFTLFISLGLIFVGFGGLIWGVKSQKVWEHGVPATAEYFSKVSQYSNGRGIVEQKYRVFTEPGDPDTYVVVTRFLSVQTADTMTYGDEVEVRYSGEGENIYVAFTPPNRWRKWVFLVPIIWGLWFVRSFVRTRTRPSYTPSPLPRIGRGRPRRRQ